MADELRSMAGGGAANANNETEAEGFASNADIMLESVTKMEWKAMEAALTHQKKTVAEMLRRACAQVRTKGELVLDDSNGKFLGDMLPEMPDFAQWCYKTHVRPKLAALPLELPDEEIKIDNVMRIMAGEAAKDRGVKKGQIGDRSVGWLEAIEPGKLLVNDAPWEMHVAKEMGTASATLNPGAPKRTKGGDDSGAEKLSEESRYRAVRNLADAIVIFETQYKTRYGVADGAMPPLQLLADARFVLDALKSKVKFTVHKCLRKFPALLSSSQFKSRHAAKFLQPYPSQLQLFKSVVKDGPRLVLLRSPPDTGKTSLAPALPELFPDHKVIFCCLARRVNLEVAQTLYNMGIPFAWVHNKQVTCSWLCGLRGASTSSSIAQMEEKLRLGVEKIQETTGGLGNQRVRKRHVQVIRPPRMFVTDVASCGWLAMQFDPLNTVLMIDEPTMGADQGGGSAMAQGSLTGCMVTGMLDAPYKTIWSSATLPPAGTLPTPIKYWMNRFSVDRDAVDELVSLQLNVGVLLVKKSGQVALPHEMVAVEADPIDALTHFVHRLRSEPLLLKAYTAQAIVAIQDRLEDEDVVALKEASGFQVEPIDAHFSDLSKLSHSSLRHYAVMVLEAVLATRSAEFVRAVCTPSSNLQKAIWPPFDAAQALLKNAHAFPGMTLTVSPTPMEQIGAAAEELVKEFPSLKKLNKDLEAQEAAAEKQLAAIRKEAEKVKGGDDRIEEIIAAKMRDLGISESTGVLKIPEHCVVNSRAHMKMYAPDEAATMDSSFFRSVPTSADFKAVDALPVDEQWRMLLLSGVAAHVPLEPVLNPKGDMTYTNYVSDQMEKGALAICGVTKDFTYGANVPCTSVLVDRDFIANHSANTLRQFIGRVARTGLAPFGVAQFEDDSFLPKMCGKADTAEAECMEATAVAILRARDAEEEK